MKKFLAVYIGTADALTKWQALNDAAKKEREQAGMNAWHEWGTQHKKVILDMGAPLGKTKRINPKGISDTKNQLTGYTIVEAESHDAAAKIFLNHPHFSMFPGDSVEIMECLPIPNL